MSETIDLLHFSPYQVTTPARVQGRFSCAQFHGNFLAQHLVCEHRSENMAMWLTGVMH